MSKSLKKLIDINRLREFKNKLVGTDSAYVQTGAVDQTIDGTKTFNSPINSPVTTGLWINGNRGVAIINSTANAGYNVLFRMKSSNGVFTGCAYDQSYQINYTTDSIVNAGTNAITYTNTLIDENGNATFSNNITVRGTVNGNLNGNVTGNSATATKATQDSDGNKITTTYSKNGHTHDDRYYTEAEVNKLLAGKANTSDVLKSWPAGVIIPFAGTSVPTGYLLCNGAAVSRTNYANLFAAIGTLYGAGNGSTTFNLPDARDRVLQGASGGHSAGSYIAAGLPNITGSVGNGGGFFVYGNSSGAFSLGVNGTANNSGYNSSLYANFVFNAHKSNALYGASNTVQSPAIATNFIIKY